MNSFWYDVLALVGALAMLFAYARYMGWRSRANPNYTIHGVTRTARARWVETVMASGKQDVLAVQTLRNSVMAASFMASTSVLLMIGVLSLSGSSDRSTGIWHALNVGTLEPQALALKLVLLLGDFFVAFFGFSMAVRFYNHVGYMINVPSSPEAQGLAPASVAFYLNRAGYHYSFGMRAFFFSVPLVFWLFGPHFLVSATAALIAALYTLDKAPQF